MRRIEKFEAITGEVFDNIEDCEAEDKEWNDAYDLITELSFYDEKGKNIVLPEIEDIFKSPNRRQFMYDTQYFTILLSDSEYTFHMRRLAYQKFLDWFGICCKISDEMSVYKTWYYDEDNAKFIPIDTKLKKAMDLINLVRKATGTLIP